MKLLLDTHSFLWFVTDDPKLSATARDAIEDPTNQIIVSIGSLWEIAIKTGIRKLEFDEPFERFIPRQLDQNAFRVLGVELRHLLTLSALPHHHRDPFDRMIIAQALTEEVLVVGADREFDKYEVRRLW